MALPLLIIPIAIAAAKATSGTALVLGGVGAVGGGASVGYTLYRLFKRLIRASSSKDSPTQEHIDSLQTQQAISDKRIDSAQDSVDVLQDSVAGINAVHAADTLERAVDEIHQSAERIQAESSTLQIVVQLTGEISDSLKSTLPAMKQLSEDIHQDTDEAVARITDLTTLLKQKEKEITQAKDDLQELQQVVDGQTAVINRLQDNLTEQRLQLGEKDTLLKAKDALLEKKDTKVASLITERERYRRISFFYAKELQKLDASDMESQPKIIL